MGLRDIEIRSGKLEELDVDLLSLPVGPEPNQLVGELDRWTGGAIERCRHQGAFRGKPGTSLFIPSPSGRPHLLLVGLGKAGRNASDVRGAAGEAVRFARSRRLLSLALALDGEATPTRVQAAAEGLMLGDYSYDGLKRASEADELLPSPERATIWSAGPIERAEEAANTGRVFAAAQNLSRSLVSQPGNVITPTRLADEASALAELGVLVQAWGREKLREEGFGVLLAVSKGSGEEPRFLILEHPGEGGAPVVLIGKGITFDSGGISLKPAKGMEEMKYDMAGAAAVLGAVRALAELGVRRRVVGLVPAAENLPSGSAVKPGDVVRGVSGRSIEIVNTDAEGRLILSDALSYAVRLAPSAIVDIATLTGGCVVALGSQASGLMSNDDELAGQIAEAGDLSGERAWRLPLFPEYRRQLDSEIADIKNSGGREASPITAGKFLEEFVDETPWAHLDIAGMAWAKEDSGCQPKGATGFGVRLLAEWVRGLG